MTSRVVPSSNSAVTTSCCVLGPAARTRSAGKTSQRHERGATAPVHRWRAVAIQPSSELGLDGMEKKPSAPFVRESAGRLEQDQAALGFDPADAAVPADLMRQRLVIESGVVPSQAEPKSAFAA